MTRVFVEMCNNVPVRIFKSKKAAIAFDSPDPERFVQELPRDFAVSAIRTAVYIKFEGHCKYCGKFVPLTGGVFFRGHMHEELPRGRGGEISTTNSVWACSECHKSQHPEKQIRFGECSKDLKNTQGS